MRRSLPSALGLACLLGCRLSSSSPPPQAAEIVLQNPEVRHGIGADGRHRYWIERSTGIDYLASNAPCAYLKSHGKTVAVTAASYRNGRLQLQFGQSGVDASIQVTATKNHFLWKVVSFTGAQVDEFVFADVPLKTAATSNGLAATALALNLQTLVRELPQPTSRLSASAFPRFGFEGAQAALIAVPRPRLRTALQEVVRAAPDLPQSPLGGPWAWDSTAARGSYLFDFGHLNENTVDDWIRLAQSLGFTQIDFHGGRSFRFGDCRVNPEVFPRGRDGFKSVIDKLHAAGISAGLHTYAFFIDKKTPWVTPVPDPRLASFASYALAEEISPEATTLPVVQSTEKVSATTGFFVRNSATLRLGQELITFTGVTKSAPYRFTGCQRGAYGTTPSAHPRGTKADHLKECFGLFVPDPHTTLLAEVAQLNADFYNQCGFDMIYLDALDGEDILGGAENGWHYGSQFVFELVRRLKKPALMEMSTFHHHLWYVRSRYGAWDHPRRAQKLFIDLHVDANESSARMFLPANLGWWSVKNWSGAQEERTFADDIEYLCGKALGSDSGLSLMGIDPRNSAGMARFAEIFKRYETLRHSGKVPKTIKEKLRAPGNEFRLLDESSGPARFRPVMYARHKIDGPETEIWTVTNHYASQPLRIRIEPLLAAAPWANPTNLTIADADNLDQFTNHVSASGLSSMLREADAGSNALWFSATNASSSRKGSWTKFERTFDPPLNLSGREGLGVWVHGDGQREILNLQLRSPEHVVAGIGDHYIDVDFTGWRYFELVEPESRRWSLYGWPYGDPYSIYRESVAFNQVSSLSFWLNEIPPGASVRCAVGPVKSLALSKFVLRNPTLTVGRQTLRLPVELESGSYLELLSETEFKVYGPNGELQTEGKFAGEIPRLQAGPNQLRLGWSGDTPGRVRAQVTVITEGEAIDR